MSFTDQSKKYRNKKVLRIAHLTDIHLQPEDISANGMISALKYVNEMDDKPDIILNGGDSIMDALDATK